nr:hypothetical protein GCM10020092_037090 [Actinoplanes digitatis]
MSDWPLWRRLQPFAALVLVAALIGIPLWLVVATAGKSQGEAINPDLSPPSQWHLLDNVRTVWTEADVLGRLPRQPDHRGPDRRAGPGTRVDGRVGAGPPLLPAHRRAVRPGHQRRHPAMRPS